MALVGTTISLGKKEEKVLKIGKVVRQYIIIVDHFSKSANSNSKEQRTRKRISIYIHAYGTYR